MIETSPEGTIGTQISKDKVEEWVDNKADPFLKPYDKRVIDNKEYILLEKKYNLFKILVIILAVAVAGILIFAYNGNFKTDINQNFTCAEIPACPTCPSTPCPANTCSLSCGNVSFPNDLNINLVNES